MDSTCANRGEGRHTSSSASQMGCSETQLGGAGKSTSQEAHLQGVPWGNEILTGEPRFAGGRGIRLQLNTPFHRVGRERTLARCLPDL